MRTTWRHIAGIVLILGLLVGCAADRLHRDGLVAIDRGEYESGVALLNQAVQNDPHNMTFRLDLQARRDAAIQQLIAMADTARGAHQLEVAAQDYKRVLALDPNNDRAKRGLAGLEGDARHGEIVAEARKDFERKDYDAAEAKLRGVLSEDQGYGPAHDLATAINTARGPITVAPRLKTRDNHKVTLQLRDAPTKMVFEVLSRETGINFILDKDVKSDTKTTIFVQDVPVEEAIDLVLDQNALARQILADNMVLIYPNIAAKQKDYEQQIVRTFYLTNAVPKDAENMLKTVLAAKTMFVDERTNVLVIRDTPDVVRMAEKLVASLDVAEPEVMLEVEVLELSRSRLQDLGIQYPTSAAFSPSHVAAAATGGTSGLVLSDLSHQNSGTINIAGSLAVTVNAMKQAGLVNTLASPRIRARNKEKAKVLIGSKEPVITNSVTPTASGAPVVTGSVQYLDVGLTLEVQPTIYLDSDVAIKLSLEVSSILKQVATASGTIAYEIGTRNANTLLRLKDGETQILAGLIQESDTRTANTIPGLGDIPILSHLFGTHHTDHEKDEIVLSITPRIIRMQPRPSSDATEFWYGTETRTRSVPYGASSAAEGSTSPPAGSAPAPTGSALPPEVPPPPAGAAPAAPAESTPGEAASAALSNSTALAAAAALKAAAASRGLPSTSVPATVPSNNPSAAAAASGAAASAASSALTLEGPSETKVGEEFQVTVRLATDQSITHLRSQLRFDASALQLVSASPGDMVPAAAGNPKVDTRGSGAQLDVTTTSDEPVQGSGSLMVLQFKAVAARPATNIMAMLNVLGGSGAAVGSSASPPLKIAIQPASQ
ncbi:MAG: type II and III secretion system protein [Gammaproteobacteria bacterium]|nr:MAG: type II and III secretion system protein [Gammaproteobacteria bacterium]TLZ48033.1 MAG: type II and III secretion system protein [Gammaproteobacteria bacterium]